MKKKLIGRGLFSRAYQISETEVELISTCPTKESVAMFSQGNRFAPKMNRIDYTDSGEAVYLMPLYPKVRAPKQQLNAKAYALYQILRRFESRFDMTLYKLRDMIEGCEMSKRDKNDFLSLAEDVCNSVDPMNLGFEISPRNITTNHKGDLILLDAFFCRKACVQAWTQKRAA